MSVKTDVTTADIAAPAQQQKRLPKEVSRQIYRLGGSECSDTSNGS